MKQINTQHKNEKGIETRDLNSYTDADQTNTT